MFLFPRLCFHSNLFWTTLKHFHFSHFYVLLQLDIDDSDDEEGQDQEQNEDNVDLHDVFDEPGEPQRVQVKWLD